MSVYKIVNPELRSTPGYTNYVIGVNKSLNGTPSSAEIKRYYSNIDAEIYFNGEWVEDIAAISWTVDQKTLPLYGYNSHVWDDMAQGCRLIQGHFIVNFTKGSKINNFISGTVNKSNISNIISADTLSSLNSPASYEIEEKWLESAETLSVDQNTGSKIENDEHSNIWKAKSLSNKKYEGFDIDIVCGEQENMSGVPLHIIFKNCAISRTGSSRDSSGSVATEQYSFVARDFAFIE